MSQTETKKSNLRRIVTTCLILAAVTTTVAGVIFTNAGEALPELRTVQAERRDLVITVGTTGTIEPEEIVQVSPDVAGKIVQFGMDQRAPEKSIGVGSRVSKDSVLFQLDTQQYEIGLQKATSAYQLAEADLGRLEAQLKQARRSLERAERLRATNAESDYDEALTAHDMAIAQLAVGRARLKQADAELHDAQVQLANTTIRSPVDGVVIDRRANLGQYVGVGSPGLFLIAKSLDRMRIRASVSESDIGKIRLHQTATFTVDAHRDSVLTGRVDEILLNARMHGNFVTYDVLVSIDPTHVELLPHMTADVEFEVVRRNQTWLVPTGSLTWWPSDQQLDDPTDATLPRISNDAGAADFQEGDHAYIWIPTSDGKVRPLEVEVGMDDGIQTEVRADNLSSQQSVVVGVVNRTALARIIPTAKTTR